MHREFKRESEAALKGLKKEITGDIKSNTPKININARPLASYEKLLRSGRINEII